MARMPAKLGVKLAAPGPAVQRHFKSRTGAGAASAVLRDAAASIGPVSRPDTPLHLSPIH